MTWAQRLQAIRAGKGPAEALPKLPKPPFVSFGSDPTGRFQPAEAAHAPLATSAPASVLHQPGNIAELRRRVKAIARVHGIDADIVRAVATDDALAFTWPMDDAALTRWLNIVSTRELYRRGLLTHGWAIPSVAHAPGTAT